ncbi:hypothetical protein ACIBG7_18700 [Nonomuraea sp. NPDC050328]|uniref:hypothetical protein n=1 Tax=Nonomuraea sp. NPDC050328 TaxID=3364361 RepID=UPI003788D49E
MADLWIAAPDTDLNAPTWAHLGTIDMPGLTLTPDEPDFEDAVDGWTANGSFTITLTTRTTWTWYGYRLFHNRTHPAARRIKRAYRRRRR